MSDWAKLRALSWRDRRLLVRAAVMLGLAKLSLRWTKLQADSCEASEAAVATDEGTHERAVQVARLVAVASARGPFTTTCLHRALVVRQLLARERIAAQVRLGARTDMGTFEAHAWVECGGVPVNEPTETATYRPFPARFGPATGGKRSPLVAK